MIPNLNFDIKLTWNFRSWPSRSPPNKLCFIITDSDHSQNSWISINKIAAIIVGSLFKPSSGNNVNVSNVFQLNLHVTFDKSRISLNWILLNVRRNWFVDEKTQRICIHSLPVLFYLKGALMRSNGHEITETSRRISINCWINDHKNQIYIGHRT